MPYEDLIRQTAMNYGVPPALAIAQAQAESSLNPNALGSRGEIGLFQLAPSTAAALGITDPWDPAQNVEGGVRYLREQYDRFGSWDLALAAYNAGPGRIAGGGSWPTGTTRYVAKILASFSTASEDMAFPTAFAEESTDRQEPAWARPSFGTVAAITVAAVVGLAWLTSE